jgi:hypothetical protein
VNEQQELVDRLRPLIAGVMSNPLRLPGTTCSICTREVGDGYQRCFRCKADRENNAAPFELGPPGNQPSPYRTADLVVPLSYAVKGHQAYTDLLQYKSAVSPSQAAQERLSVLTALFQVCHGRCIDRVIGQPVTDLAVLPSLQDRQGPHPLQSISHHLPRTWQRIQLTAARYLPADPAARRQTNPAFFHCPEPLHNRHVVLFDDTWVTGGHAQGAALCLRNAGAARVTVLTLGRCLEPSWPDTLSFLRRFGLPMKPYDVAICPVTGGSCPTGPSTVSWNRQQP